MDWLLWVVRAIIIVAGIILIIKMRKGKKGYAWRFFAIAIMVFILGVFLLIVSFITDLSLFYGLYLIAAGAIAVIIGLVIRNIWEKKH